MAATISQGVSASAFVSQRLQSCKMPRPPAAAAAPFYSSCNAGSTPCSSNLWSSASSCSFCCHNCSARCKAQVWCGVSRLNVADGRRTVARAQVREAVRSSFRVETGKRSEVGSMVLPTPMEEPSFYHSPTFQNAKTEEDLFLGITKEVESKRIPPHAGTGMKDLYQNYRDAVIGGGSEGGLELVVNVMAMVLDRILLQFEDPFTFPSYHQRMREPFDYYQFGQDYIRPLLDFNKSFLGNKVRLDEIEHWLKKGHNIVLLSNHQTEADPAVIALLLESTHPYLAENLIYVAGDRVVLDPFCKPFSMGRNLLCVYSKKHIEDEPELVEMKRRANTRTLKEMTLLLRKASQLIWIAPSGGRDRPSPTGDWKPAVFDSSAVENMKRLLEHSGAPGHMYPLAVLCHDIMPPPNEVQKEIGERRLFGYNGVGVSVGQELELTDVAGGSSTAGDDFTEVAWSAVSEQYAVLRSAVHGGKGLDASTTSTTLSQPWLDHSSSIS
ncbi:hypothetical protein O6H91_09G086200 [Diphasiastrum complanatum]|uniref:Uncharacterized protein n=1 Tax=Diphasiastrum complanatum TaxID=34168 RepID=A0ACC2CRL5_DIPCM|nr:hypothetical protein O6H91_09G086200 [Diphasiastrum complanatum]